jgi:hypothetical protein
LTRDDRTEKEGHQTNKGDGQATIGS